MPKKYFKEKETEQERIQRWRDTPRDAFGLFTGVPNQKAIVTQIFYYGESNRANYDYQESKKKRASNTTIN